MTTIPEPQNFEEVEESPHAELDELPYDLDELEPNVYVVRRPDGFTLLFGSNPETPLGPGRKTSGWDLTFYDGADDYIRMDWAPWWSALVDIIRQFLMIEVA